MKRIIHILLVAVMLLSMVACGGGGETPSGNDGEKIVIYTGGSSEFIWTEGADEQAVWEAVEKKYFEDTGIKLDFEVNFMGQDMKSKVSTAVSGGFQVDIMISHTSGGDGIDDWMYINNNYADLFDAIDAYGDNIKANSVWTDGTNSFDALKRLETTDGDIIGIPSVINPYKFGILVRKDWMEACGYTNDPAKASTHKLVKTLEDFEAMALAMKEKYVLNYASTGAIFDLEKVGLVGAFGLDAGYYTNTVYEYNGEKYLIPGGGQEAYQNILALEAKWAKSGVINKSGDSVRVEQGESEFVAEATGIFFQDPTVTHLITVAQKCKLANPDAEFTVLGALTKDDKSTDKGFMRNSVATFAASVFKTSTQVDNIVKFVDWMYSDPDNYLMCMYGIEGVHWVNNGDGTYSYCGDYNLTNKPYSGVLALVENQNVANLTYKGYSEEELSWLATAQNKDNYINNPTVDVLLLTNDEALNTPLWSAYSAISAFCQKSWRGINSQEYIFNNYKASTDQFMNLIANRGKVMYQTYKTLTES